MNDHEIEIRDAILDALLHLARHVDAQFELAHVVDRLRQADVRGSNWTPRIEGEILDAVDDLVRTGIIGWGCSLPPNMGPLSGWPFIRVRPKGHALLAKHRERREREAKEQRRRDAESEEKAKRAREAAKEDGAE